MPCCQNLWAIVKDFVFSKGDIYANFCFTSIRTCGIDYLANLLFHMVNFDYTLTSLAAVKLMSFMRYRPISCSITCPLRPPMGSMLNHSPFSIEDNSTLINKKKIEHLKNQLPVFVQC